MRELFTVFYNKFEIETNKMKYIWKDGEEISIIYTYLADMYGNKLISRRKKYSTN